MNREIVCLAAKGILVLCGVSSAFGQNLRVLRDHVPKAAANLAPIGQMPATNQLRLAIGIPLRDPAGLDAYLGQVYDPASPIFHQYLTLEEFTARFGPTEHDYEAVRGFAQTNGLTITGTHANRLLLDVVGPASAVERAFHLTLRTYRHPTEARDFYAPDREPALDAALAVADVQGLSDYSKPHPRLRMRAAAGSAPKGGSAPDGSGDYFGNDLRNAYAPGVTLTGAGQSIGVLEFDGFYAGDIAAYAAAAGNGRSSIAIQTVLVDGYSGTPTTGSSSGSVEVSLDIEMAMAMAPGLTKIVSFEAGPYGLPNDLLNSMLSYSSSLKQLSSSWGWSGGPSTTMDNIFKSMAAVGQSFFNASGDSDAFTTGSHSANGADNTSLYNAPSSSPYITQTGGTTLTMNGNGASYASETVWNWGYDSAAGAYVGGSGGISSYYAIPSWQAGISMSANGGSTSFRNIPDVALTADGIYVDEGNGGSETVGGTSCAAPLWAGFIALANQQAAANGKAAVGFINPAIYSLAAGPSYASCFHDITTGNNTSSASPSLFYATTGYDLCTGLGTPAGQSLINALAGSSDTLAVAPQAGFAASGLVGGPFGGASETLTLTNSGAAALSWSVINSATWINLLPAGGVLANNQQIIVTATLTPAAATLPIGNYSASVWFTNQTTGLAQLRQFTLQVLQPLAVSPTNGFTSTGPAGGPFSVTSQSYVLTNLGAQSLIWNLVNTSTWLNISPTTGTLPAGGQATLTASLSATADNLGVGTYAANVQVTNLNGGAISLLFALQAGPLVQNGGFESGSFSGWTMTGSASYNAVTSSSSFVHSGAYGAELGQLSPLGYLSQTIATSPGQNYLLSLWLDNPTSRKYAATPNQFLVQWNGATLFNQTNLPFMGWTNLQFFVTATSASTVLQFGFQDTPHFLGLDDISLIPLSSPSFNVAQAPTTGFNLAWNTTAGLIYQVQYKTDLLQTNWINLGSPLVAAGTSLSVSDTNPATSSPQRFYRLMVSP